MHPFSYHGYSLVSSLTEDHLLQSIRAWIKPIGRPTPEGMGDDCAVFKAMGPSELITTDSVVYQRHFTAYDSPKAVGAKLVCRNLSDIAAMGGVPDGAVLSLVSSPELCLSWLEAFFQGIVDTCAIYGVRLLGGDLAKASCSNFFSASWTQLGNCLSPLMRHGAQEGDMLLVTGSLGGSSLGGHLHFVPRLKEGVWLSKQAGVNAAIDVSDGLAKDLPALLGSHQRALVNISKIPINQDAHTLAKQKKIPPWHLAFTEGEDYELLFTLSGKETWASFRSRWQENFALALTPIGTVAYTSEAAGELILDTHTQKPLVFQGFDALQA